MNIPNSLTIFRILLIPVYIGFMIYGRYGFALLSCLSQGSRTPWMGLSRGREPTNEFRHFLDPLADKLLLTSGFISLSSFHLIPSWVIILVVSRDVMLLLGTVVAHVTNSPIDITPTFLGKGTTFLQLSYVLLVVFLSSRDMELDTVSPLLISMVGFTVASGLIISIGDIGTMP